jgi:tRNA1Val (adenine37-N6)-methyltransferase
METNRSEMYFQFKQFAVRHDGCAMKVGTDGALLGAWADCGGAATILDVGTGSGLIALMLAQRSEARIDAVDVDEAACRVAGENFERSPFAARLRVVQGDYRYFSPGKKYERVVSNPPYFVSSLQSPDGRRNGARHADTLSVHDLLERSASLLTADGRLSLIFPADGFESVREIAEQTGFYLLRRTWVSAVENRPPKRVLLEYGRRFAPPSEDRMCIETASHVYSREYVALTKAFYLKM